MRVFPVGLTVVACLSCCSFMIPIRRSSTSGMCIDEVDVGAKKESRKRTSRSLWLLSVTLLSPALSSFWSWWPPVVFLSSMHSSLSCTAAGVDACVFFSHVSSMNPHFTYKHTYIHGDDHHYRHNTLDYFRLGHREWDAKHNMINLAEFTSTELLP